MTASAHIVTVGAMPSPATDGTAVAAALGAAGVAVVSRVFVEDDEGALERVLGADEVLTVVLAGGGGSAGDIVRRVLARVTGARLVLNERLLTTLQERYRRLDRPLPRRAERLALLPQGATVWVTADADAGWAMENGQRAFAVLTRDAALQSMLARHLTPFAREWAGARGAAMIRTLRTAGLAAADVEERLDHLRRRRGVGEAARASLDAGRSRQEPREGRGRDRRAPGRRLLRSRWRDARGGRGPDAARAAIDGGGGRGVHGRP